MLSATEAAHGSAQYRETTLVLLDAGNAPVLLDEPCRLRELCRDRDVGMPAAAAASLMPASGLVAY